jgi:hypothetical protein
MTARIESRAMRRFLVILATAAAGCGGPAFEHALPSSPLVAAQWDARFEKTPTAAKSGEEEKDKKEKKGEEGAAGGGGVRAEMIAEAKRLLADTAERPEYGYGARDLDEILARVSPAVAWDAESGLEKLVASAREKGAFHGDASPKPGDVAFFHNQVDADADGAPDDWFTGCAIVIDTDGPRFRAVARTGRAPREIVVWPDGPAVATLDGDKVNSYLRVPRRSDPADAEYLAGRLFAGYVDIEAFDAAAKAK